MKQELKCCPCCGGYAKYEYKTEKEPSGIREYVRGACQNCGISTLYHPLHDLLSAFPDKYSPIFSKAYEPFSGEEIVAKEWNRRIEQEMAEEKNNVTDYISEEEYQNIDESVLALSLDDIRYKIIDEKGFCNLSYDVITRLSYNTDENYREKFRTIGDLVRLSPEELAVSVGCCGEQGYNEIVDFLEMNGIDTHRYRTYHYNVDISSFHILYDCNFSIRTFHALYYNGKIETVGDLIRLSPEELMKIKGIGKKGYSEVVDNLKELGLDIRKYTK